VGAAFYLLLLGTVALYAVTIWRVRETDRQVRPGQRDRSLAPAGHSQTSMPWPLLAGCALIGIIGGATFGFVRGLDHTATLVFAIVEGAILFGIPASLVGLLLCGGWWITVGVRHR
jgi:hypothetical protein